MHKTKILIVDDEVDILDMLSEFFEEEECIVTKAGSGKEAIKFIENEQFQIVLSDFRMPNGTGLDLLNKVNTLSLDIRPKFFFMTGFADISEDEAIKTGALRFFRKPFRVNEVVDEILKYR